MSEWLKGFVDAREQAAKLLESKAIFSKEAIEKATAFQLLDNIHSVERSENARKDASEIRAMNPTEQPPQADVQGAARVLLGIIDIKLRDLRALINDGE